MLDLYNNPNWQTPNLALSDGSNPCHRTGFLPRRRTAAGHRPGRRKRRSPDDGLHERRKLCGNPGHRPGRLLQPQPQKLWRKGEESGNVQRVRAIYVDCDLDTILLSVEQIGGAACHEGYKSCFFRKVVPAGLEVVAQRVFDPAEVYKK